MNNALTNTLLLISSPWGLSFFWFSPILSVPLWVGFLGMPTCKLDLGDAWQQIRPWGCQGQPYGQKGLWAEELSFKSMQAASSLWFKSKPLRSSVALKFFAMMVYHLLASINVTVCTEQFIDMCSSTLPGGNPKMRWILFCRPLSASHNAAWEALDWPLRKRVAPLVSYLAVPLQIPSSQTHYDYLITWNTKPPRVL